MADKRVTKNFVRYKVYTAENEAEFVAWRNDAKDQQLPVAFDRRNNIYCINPTMDFRMYYNYCNYLNECYSEWQHYGYFDMGMVPYLMWPSFMNSTVILEKMRSMTRAAGVDLIQVPAVAFLRPSYSSTGTDYWMTRENMVKLCQYLDQTNPQINNYNITSPEQASLTAFLKPLADLEATLEGMT